MGTQKILKPKEILIIADYREKEVIAELKKLGAIVKVKALDVADFVCSSRVGVERKSYNDFIGSIINGRIFEQAENLKRGFKKQIILIEGYSNRDVSQNALKAALASLVVNYNISLVSTKNVKDTARTIYWIAKKEQTGKRHAPVYKIRKKPKEIAALQESIVSSLPGISQTLSKRLLKRFGSINKIINAEESELRKVEGIGSKLAGRIKGILS